ncbi:RNA polymerase sigma factor [Anaeromassilibacillus sp. An200]|uniref:RNA polymerase sigma factor n=1 Tax=Anaeromassilibacillus sp. An200 TaxID=1965587 RepID=UPI000B3843B9|nr:sigma factor-like helix-turn-helix DNA-binding protein [Anaeromassilibacillus sp. An200]OUP05550.1 RNA polymerase subunit sigma-70 [Anaeromassilibacillus sp. An200]
MDADKKRIWIRGQYVEVTDEVYAAYMQGDRKMRYFENDLKTERFVLGKEGQVVQIIPSREDSLDRLVDENTQQFSDKQESVESVVLHKLEVDRLHTALSLLAPEERALIQALFFDERKESELAMELGISQPAVYKRKMKVLKKLKLLLEG